MKLISTLFAALSLLCASHVNAGSTSYSLDYIHGEGDVDGLKVAVQYHTDLLKEYNENLELYFESSVNFWRYGDENIHDSNFVLAISPVIQYPVGELWGKRLYAEFGIGVSLIDDTKFAGKDISTHYQFEDRLGVMTRFGQHDENEVALRYFHYSNAGFKKPNPGLDFIAVSYMRYF